VEGFEEHGGGAFGAVGFEVAGVDFGKVVGVVGPAYE